MAIGCPICHEILAVDGAFPQAIELAIGWRRIFSAWRNVGNRARLRTCARCRAMYTVREDGSVMLCGPMPLGFVGQHAPVSPPTPGGRPGPTPGRDQDLIDPNTGESFFGT